MANPQELIDNPDPRIKWAMDVMDQEGEEFEGVIGKSLAPLSFAALPPATVATRNMFQRLPMRTTMFPAILLMFPFAAAGLSFRKWTDNQHAEESAMIKHYILTHPELFPEPKKVKYIDHIQPWKPLRW